MATPSEPPKHEDNIPKTSVGKVAGSDEDQNPRGMFTLSRDLLEDWTGTGRGSHVDFGFYEAVPLTPGRILGFGSSGFVRETTVQGVSLAWKPIRSVSRTDEHHMESPLSAEVQVLKKISHIHILQVVGSYISRGEFSLLLYPVAVYDLENLLEDPGWQRTLDETMQYVRVSHTRHQVRHIVSRIGCIASAVAYLHRSGVRHNNLNPSHILLSPGGLWLTGFGNATDSLTETDSFTDAWRQTREYSAPEVADFRSRGRSADIFSLGCIFLEILVLLQTGSRPQFPDSSVERSYCAHLGELDIWLAGSGGLEPLENMIRAMLSFNSNARPTANDLLHTLSTMETTTRQEIIVFNSCCRLIPLPSVQKQHDVWTGFGSHPDETVDTHHDSTYMDYNYGKVVREVKMDHAEAFVDRLIHEFTLQNSTIHIEIIPHQELRSMLRTFAGRLYEESVRPIQWRIQATFYEEADTVEEHILLDLYRARINADTANEEFVEHGQPYHTSSTPHDNIATWTHEVKPSPQSWAQKGSVYPSESPTSPPSQILDAFICQSAAYRWLLSRVGERSQASGDATDARDFIGNEVLQTLRTRRMSKGSPMPECSVVFWIEWEPQGYIEDLGLLSALPSIFDHVLCLTGTCYAAQAMTVADYVHQTWPITGHRILSLLSELISVDAGQKCSYTDRTSVGVQFEAQVTQTGWCLINATGGPCHISEAAEQIAWLAATLRSSYAPDNVTLVTPSIEALKVFRPVKELSEIRGTCIVKINGQQGSRPIFDINGTCWTKLFSKAVLVGGYPISRRLATQTGLEISLGVMASLVRSSQVVRYDDRIVIKGFSSLLIATRLVDSTFLWHAYQSNVEGERISYFDPQVVASGQEWGKLPPLRALENAVHILGWCSEATDFCGDRTACCDVTGSSVPHTPASTYIDRLYIEAGMYCIGGITMRPNKHEKPTKLARHTDYFQYLDWVSRQPVAFYDTCDHRAWLIDGASALLHLARISLYRDQNDPERSFHWTFENDKLKDTWPGRPGRLAAKKSLMDWDNLSLPVYQSAQCLREGKIVKEFSTFQDRVFGILLRLETLIDCLIYLASQDGFAITQTLDKSKGLIGFDVFDIIAPDGPVKSRTAPFHIYGDGWVDLLPAIKTLTIFGQNFGELIRPNNPDSICTQWQSIPKGQNYLVSTVSTLKKLHEVQGWRQATLSDSDQLTSSLSWKSPTRPFEPCKCISDSNICDHSDPVQYVVSKSSLRSWKLKNASPVDLHTLDSEGAVVFANLTLSGKKAPMVKQKASQAQAGNANLAPSSSRSGSLTASASLTAGSSTAQSAASTNTTQSTASPMSSNVQGGVIREESRLKKWKEKVVERLKR